MLPSLIKKTVLIVAVIFVLLIIIAIMLPRLIDTDAFREKLITQVKETTGQTLTIDGELSVSTFPWLGIETGKIALSQAETLDKGTLLQPIAHG